MSFQPNRSHGIANGHQCDTEIAAPLVGKLGGDSVGGGQQSADPEPGGEAPDFESCDLLHARHHEHASGANPSQGGPAWVSIGTKNSKRPTSSDRTSAPLP